MDDLELARQVLRKEAQAIEHLVARLDEKFLLAIRIIEQATGKIAVTGVGKSGLICKKIAATLASTGTPAFFLHAGDAVHGDLGMLCEGDVVLAVSNSGCTREILDMTPVIRKYNLRMIALTGDLNSELSRTSDVALNVRVDEEADPLGVAPTASTTAALALGDAIAIVLLQRRGFQLQDFADVHPGGKLGQRLRRVGELMHHGADLPVVREETLMRDTIYVISSKGLGVTTVIGDLDRLTGVVTDGDLRRAMSANPEMLSLPTKLFMTSEPILIARDDLCVEALKIMKTHSITALIIVDHHQHPIGVLKLQDIIESGTF